jgi:hypothetical protein
LDRAAPKRRSLRLVFAFYNIPRVARELKDVQSSICAIDDVNITAIVGRHIVRLDNPPADSPPGGLGQRYAQMTGWLDANCGADGWVITPSGLRGGLNDAISIYFADATFASGFVARWSKVETAGGVFQVREDEPVPRIGAVLHRTLWGEFVSS